MDKSDYIDTIANSAAALHGAGRVDVTAEVPSCPGWKVTDVLTHVGGVHRWAASIVRSGTRPDVPMATPGDADLVSWAMEGTTELVTALEAADPDADVWTFGLPRSVRFWLRRQANETTLHAWDATNAVGEPLVISAPLAADGLDEYLDMVPRGVKRVPGSWAGETVHIHRTDGPGEWLVTLGPGGEATIDRTHTKADVAVRGSAADLYLWATNRGSTDALEVFGDADLLTRWAADVHF